MEITAAENSSDHTISFVRANAVALGLFGAVAVVGFSLHSALWQVGMQDFFDPLVGHDLLPTLLVVAGSIVLHEVFHALGFLFIGKAPRSSVRFGFNWKALAPYAGTSAVMTARAYRWSAALPSLFLGVPQLLAGVALGWELGTVYGVIMLGAAGGDYAALWAMRGIPSDTMVRDSHDRVGCEVVLLEGAGCQ